MLGRPWAWRIHGCSVAPTLDINKPFAQLCGILVTFSLLRWTQQGVLCRQAIDMRSRRGLAAQRISQTKWGVNPSLDLLFIETCRSRCMQGHVGATSTSHVCMHMCIHRCLGEVHAHEPSKAHGARPHTAGETRQRLLPLPAMSAPRVHVGHYAYEQTEGMQCKPGQ